MRNDVQVAISKSYPAQTTKMKRLVVIFATLIGIPIACVFSAGWLLAHPVQTRIGDPPADLNAQAVTFASDSGANVHGWWCPIQNGRGSVLLLPGIRANRLSMVDRARFLRRAGYSVLLIDFQGTGETKGINFLRQTDPTDHIAIIGSSLGAVAALLATPPLKIDALILEAVYPTIEIATRNRMENYLGGVGRILTPFLLNQLHWRLGISAFQLRPVDHIGDVQCPVFLMSGAKDRSTRPSDTQMLVHHAQSPKQVWFVPNAGHVDLHRATGADYESRVLAFLKQM